MARGQEHSLYCGYLQTEEGHGEGEGAGDTQVLITASATLAVKTVAHRGYWEFFVSRMGYSRWPVIASRSATNVLRCTCEHKLTLKQRILREH